MVANVHIAVACDRHGGRLASETAPLQPNHNPPRFSISPSSATARPPACCAGPARGTRLDTTTSRFIEPPAVRRELRKHVAQATGVAPLASAPSDRGPRPRHRVTPTPGQQLRGSITRFRPTPTVRQAAAPSTPGNFAARRVATMTIRAAFVRPGEADRVIRQRSLEAQRHDRCRRANSAGCARAQSERTGDHRLLHPPVPPVRQQRGGRASRRERRLAGREIDRPAVVGIDQGKIPELGALVEVGHARRWSAAAASAPGRSRRRRARSGPRRRRSRAATRAAAPGSSSWSRKSRHAASYSAFGAAQPVRRLASRSDFSCQAADPLAERRHAVRVVGREAERPGARPGSGTASARRPRRAPGRRRPRASAAR